MTESEDLYRILGVGPQASSEEIRRAYIKKARLYHPDAMRGLSSIDLALAEKRMKEVNRAYEVLGNPDRRRQYHATWTSRHSLPRPVIDGAIKCLTEATPRQKYTGYFVVRNSGGPYDSLSIKNSSKWVKVASCRPLHRGTELPMRVEIEVEGRDWGQTYSETVTVSLDGQEAQASVELRTRARETRSSSPASASRRRRRLALRNTGMYGLSTYSKLGQVTGAAIGLVAALGYVAMITLDLITAAPWPHLQIMGGLIFGTAGALGFGAIGTACGFVAGWLVGAVAGLAQYAVMSASNRL